jgi:hypothetical protein
MAKGLLCVGLMAAMTLISGAGCANRLNVLLLADHFPGSDAALEDAIKSSLAEQGFRVRSVKGDQLAENLLATPASAHLLVLPNSACFPAEARPALLEFLKSGGNLLTIGGPPLSRQVIKLDGQWLTQQMLTDKLAAMPPEGTVLDFGKVDLSKVQRESGTPETAAEIRVIRSDIHEAPSAMEIRAPSVNQWEFHIIPIGCAFPAGQTVTTFWARGSANARRLMIAWIDSDDASWRATIDLTESWKRYAITAGMFQHWHGPKGGRFQSRKAVALKVGFEHHNLGHSYQPASFAISDIRSMPNPAGDPDFTQPTLETLCPFYKTYSTTAQEYVPTQGSYVSMSDSGAIAGPIRTICSLPRYRGMGFNRTAPHRWIPQLAVKMADGHVGGAAAALYVQDDQTYKGSVWATFGVEDPDFIVAHRDAVAQQIASLARRIDDRLFLLSGGTDRASYFDASPVLGAVVLNLNESRNAAVTVNCQVALDPKHNDSPFKSRLLETRFPLNGKRTIHELGTLKDLAPGFYIATTSLYHDGRLIDEIRQPFSVVESKPVDKSELVTIQGDQLYYKGKPWYSLGINYRPLYVAAMEEEPFWKYWTHADQYDPEIIEMELDLMNTIGLNTVALIYPDLHESIPPAFVDFLERVHRHAIKCHVYISGLEPFSPKPEKTLKLIKAARLWERPAMFAYDTGWEIRIGREKRRAELDPQWKRWIEDRYGSVEDAQKDWHFDLRREPDGRVHGPTDDQISGDGPWKLMVAAYRRFCDDLLSRRYMKTAQVIHDIDPYHPISVRSGFGGTGTMAAYALPAMPVDLFSGAKHLHYISPEGYNFSGDWPSFREGGLTTLYGKFVSGGKPVYWAELGISAFPPTADALETQREYYEKIYRAFYETRSAGSAAWWWPGFLIWEQSDNAVVNPDFTLRPAAHEFTKMSKIAAEPAPRKEPDYWIEIDRDLHATGYAGVLQEKRRDYGQAVAAGKTVGLRTKGTGTDSSNFPRVAVGNTPLNGHNPPKFLNAEFNSLEIQGADGKWVAAEDGATIAVKPGSPVLVRASVGNIAEARWLAPASRKSNDIHLRSVVGGKVVLSSISADTPFLSDAQVLAFRLTSGITTQTLASFQMALGEICFGEKRYINLVPAD